MGPGRLLLAGGLLVLVIVMGVVGYRAIEGWSWFDAFYMTITTMTTIGGGEPKPLSYLGRWWTLALIAFGVGVTAYAFLMAAGYFLEGQFFAAFGKRRLRGRVRALRDHYILCGYGRVGREVAEEIVAAKSELVIIDVNQPSLDAAARDGYLVVSGNAADVEILHAAGIDRARGLAVATDNDADNVFVTLSARVLRPDLFIVARANSEDSEPKLKLAGANRIISPYSIGGKRMAHIALRPTAVEFIDTVLEAGNADLLLEDITIQSDSAWIGKTLGALAGPKSDAIVLAIKRNNLMLFRPAEDTQLQAGDEIVAAGPTDAVMALEARL